MITTRLPSHQSYLSVDWQHPIDRTHHLNKGLVGWWLNVPHLQGGTILHDLAGENHGNLTNMNPATDWVQGGRLGGFGALDFDGIDDRVETLNLPIPSSAISLFVWVNRSSGGGGSRIAVSHYNTNPLEGAELDASNGINVAIALITSAGTKVITAPQPAEGVWHHLGLTWDGATFTMYKDGVVVAAEPLAGTITGTARPLIIGNFIGGGHNYSGKIDDVREYSRALSASQVAEYFQLSQQGYPGIFNRWQRRAYSISAAILRFRPIGSAVIQGMA